MSISRVLAERGHSYAYRLADVTVALALAAPALAADRSAVVMPVPGKPYFIQLDPMFFPVIENNSVPRQVSVAIAIEIADGAKAKDVEDKRRLLHDAFVGELYRYVQQRGGIGDPEGETALKGLLETIAQRVLDPVQVKEVEIEEFFQQRR